MSNMFNNNFNYFINSTGRYICISTLDGFSIYSINPFKKLITREITGGVSIIRMLNESNIFLFSGRTEEGPYPNNKLFIWDDNKKKILGEILYNHKIEDINVTEKYIYVKLNKKIYIYNFDDISLLKCVDTIDTNFSISNNNVLVYPSINTGEIIIYNIETDISNSIKAHESTIQIISLSQDGNYLATASEKGTIIRLFDIRKNEQINELRVGTEYTKIIQIAFHHNNRVLLVETDKYNIHLFNTELNIEDDKLEIPENNRYENYGINYVKFILPKYFHSKWSFLSLNSGYLVNVNTLNVFDDKTLNIYSFDEKGEFREINLEDVNSPKITKIIQVIGENEKQSV